VTAALFALASISALRGAWSPCGLSMLSTITPLAERARRHRYWHAAVWFGLGATLGGVTLGMGMVVGALVLDSAVGVAGTAAVVIAAVVTATCLAADAEVLGARLPEHPRQVDATWVARFRLWAYAGGYGFQLGTGVSTYVMTNATYAVICVGMVTLRPAAALWLGVAYGISRGATILLGAAVTTPTRLRAVHRWLAATDRASLAVAMAAQLGLLAVCVAELDSRTLVALGGSLLVVLLAACVVRLRSLASRAPAALR
jgi:hypothetical protein